MKISDLIGFSEILGQNYPYNSINVIIFQIQFDLKQNII
jgi:hypothetical protein